MPAVRAVLFDFFGTLSRAVTRGPAHAAIARHLGCEPVDLARVLNRTFMDRAKGALGSPEEALRAVAVAAGGNPSRAALRTALRDRVDAVRADTRLRPEAVPTLTALHGSGLRLGVVSDCGPELPAFLPDLPIADLLDTAVYSIEVGACKPAAAMYLAACVRLGVAPHECVYVGDGGSRELSGAAAVGMRPVRLAAPDLVWHLGFDVENWSGPSVRSLLEVPSLIAWDLHAPVPRSGRALARH
jgi:putative hydrolase of the HAD superfamily